MTAAIIAATTFVIGGVTVLALHSYLVSQLDNDLRAASHRSLSSAGVIPPAPKGRPTTPDKTAQGKTAPTTQDDVFVGSPGQAADTAVAIITRGKVVGEGYIDESGTRQNLSARDQSIMRAVPTNGKPYTRDLGSDLGSYRLVSSTIRSDTILITGLPLAPMQSTIDQLMIVIGGVTLAGVLVAASAAAATIRRALRPLHRVAETAAAVSELTLDRGDVPVSVRVRPKDIVSGSEVGRVGSALNQLLNHVGAALDTRQAADEKIRRFAADASHELRTPLATVRAYAELSRREFPAAPADLRRNIDRIESETIRMTELVDDLLLLARLDTERELVHINVDLSEILVDAVRDARAIRPENVWQIEMDEEPVVIDGDPDRLKQVAANLLSNARIHVPAGTTVRSALHRADDGVTILDISDDGPGIDPGLLPLIFERFVRADDSRSRRAGSTGLGLAIVRAIVEAHHGDISVTSVPGDTRFRVRLGIAAPAADRARP
jgi:two-component system OmpR family sensor kinase